MDGTPDEVFARREELCRVGLDVPQCAELIHKLRDAGIPLEGNKISTIEECVEMLSEAFDRI